MTSFTVRRLLEGASDGAVRSVLAAWEDEPSEGECTPELLARLSGVLTDGGRVERRLAALPCRLADLLETFLGRPSRARNAADLLGERDEPFCTLADMEARLAALHREGFLFPVSSGRSAAYALPGELAGCIRDLRRRQRSEIHDTITLEGFLAARYFHDRDKDPDGKADEHARKIYRLYLLDDLVRARVERLPPRVRSVFDAVVTRHGGLASWEDVAAESLHAGRGEIDLVRKSLEEAMLGTVAPLPLRRFGLKSCARAVVVFHEITLRELHRRREERDLRVERTLEAGVDLVGNVGRFLREVETTNVQITRAGGLYKAAARRLARRLRPIAGGQLDGEAQLRLLFGFCSTRRLIGRRGERALRVTPEGSAFEARSLHDKLRALLSYVVEERPRAVGWFHQVRLRRVLLRLLRRAGSQEWIETPTLPFVARNGYLSRLEELGADGDVGRLRGAAGALPPETLGDLCAGLQAFLKRRLFPLGLVDLGLEDGRPVAVRLSRLGVELLGEPSSDGEVGGVRSSLVVNPDFEVIVFPGDDVHEVLRAFDRFAERIESDRLHHFRLSPKSLRAGLEQGLTVAEVLAELGDRARAPIPQNVVYSLEDWERAGATGDRP